MVSLSDKELVSLAQGGEGLAFEELIRRHERRAHRVALRILRDHDDAADALQVAFFRLHVRLKRFRGESRFSTWLTRIVINAAIDGLRARQRRRTVPTDPSELRAPHPDSAILQPVDAAIRGELRERLADLLDRLPEIFRTAVALRYLQDLSCEQIAAIQGCPTNTVKTRLFRGRKLLDLQMRESGAAAGLQAEFLAG